MLGPGLAWPTGVGWAGMGWAGMGWADGEKACVCHATGCACGGVGCIWLAAPGPADADAAPSQGHALGG